MKRVLILSVIAMLALGVFAMAAGSVSVGPTCQPATLTVTSNIIVVQGFQATATSYDATFCGALGYPLRFTGASQESGVLLASLIVKSNMATIDVAVTPSFSGSSSLSTSILSYYANGSSWTGPSLSLPNGGSSPYTGELDVVVPNNNYIPQWTQAGANVLTISFVVTPKSSF